jgi:hypothetical protein
MQSNVIATEGKIRTQPSTRSGGAIMDVTLATGSVKLMENLVSACIGTDVRES